MGRGNMTELKIVARIVALGALILWCAASVSARQQRQMHPPQKPVTQTKITHPVRHWTARPLAAGHGARPGTLIHRPEKQVRAQAIIAKKPEAPKPEAAPTALTPIALADQTPALPESGHGRDPFEALIRPTDPNAGHANLPPGIAGLQVATLRLEGMVKTSDGMVAVVANSQDSVYFIHDGDHIYDGVVEKIGIDDVTFRQESKDAFGRTIDRDVSKRLYPIAGDEQ
jgi:hypothetical protein